MVGAFPEILVAVLIVDDFEGESFTLEFPTLEVDSTPVVIPSIEFDRTVKHGIMACIQ
jgi:hypothetical protein